MNSIKAKGISDLAKKSLQSNSELCIHSVFDNSMNLLSGEQLIYVGERALPFGLQIENFENIKETNKVVLDHEKIIFYLDDKNSSLSLNDVSLIDDKHQGKLSRLNDKVLILEKKVRLLNEKPLEFYIGRGQGLTPSGDDFLVGMYCVSFCDESIPNMMSSLSNTQFEGLTTSISLAYLNAARKGYFNPDLIKLLSCDTRMEFESLLKSILNIGHSSGMDTLEGILFGLKMIQKEHTNENENCCSAGW